jgi:hypothetical protein
MKTIVISSDKPVPSVAASRVETCIKGINEAFGFSVGWLVNVGGLLNQAKDELAHGQWMSMFERGKLKFGLRTAEMLMAIARHPCLRNANYVSNLPNSWSVLYVLSKLPPTTIECEIGSGVIHPELKLAQARAIVQRAQADAKAPQRKPAVKAFDFERQQRRLTSSLSKQAAHWPADQHIRLAELLEELARKLRTGGNQP